MEVGAFVAGPFGRAGIFPEHATNSAATRSSAATKAIIMVHERFIRILSPSPLGRWDGIRINYTI
jgi:hypothetical protein